MAIPNWCYKINDNFWQPISVFMFQRECMVNLDNLFSKPSTPILTWTNPRQSFLWNDDYTSHFTYDNSSVSVRFNFLDHHIPYSACVWSVWFDSSTMKTCLDVNVLMIIRCCFGRNMPLTFDVMHALHFWCVIYISTASFCYCLCAIPDGNKICPVQGTNLYILISLLIFSTSNELPPHLRNLLAHSMANIKSNSFLATFPFIIFNPSLFGHSGQLTRFFFFFHSSYSM